MSHKVGIAVVLAFTIIAICIVLLVVPTSSRKIGEGKLVMINGMWLEGTYTSASAGMSSAGGTFIGLNDTYGIAIYRVSNIPDVVRPNTTYEIYNVYNVFGLHMQTEMRNI